MGVLYLFLRFLNLLRHVPQFFGCFDVPVTFYFSSQARRTMTSAKGSLHTMDINKTTNRKAEPALRALQLIFAIIVTGTDGYGMES
jgi:hypothetical protein